MASEYLKKKYQDVKPDAPVELTKAEKRKNWWYYHKWHVGAVVLLAAVIVSIVWPIVNRVTPDVQVAYVGEMPLPEDAAAALEEALAGLTEDLNGDGKVLVELRQYVSAGLDGRALAAAGSPVTDATGQMTSNALMTSDGASQIATMVSLLADVGDQESFLFLLEDPAAFQQEFHTLCRLDGSLPEEGDDSVENSVLAWDECPVLAGLDLGDYSYDLFGGTISGDSNVLYSRLFIGRRGFWREDEDPALQAGFTALWEKLTEGAAS